jgi:hypothetical protein
MNESYECPDCDREHDEPVSPTLGRFVRCLDCEIERNCDIEPEAALPDAA